MLAKSCKTALSQHLFLLCAIQHSLQFFIGHLHIYRNTIDGLFHLHSYFLSINIFLRQRMQHPEGIPKESRRNPERIPNGSRRNPEWIPKESRRKRSSILFHKKIAHLH